MFACSRHQLTVFLSAFMLSVSLLFVSTSVTFAASPSPKPSASPKPTPDPTPQPPSETETTQKLKERIDRVIEQRREQVQGVMDQIGLKKRGFIGEVLRVTEKTITIKNRKGTQTLTIGLDVSLQKDNKRASIDDIAVGDWLIVMGYVDKEEFILKKIIISSTSLHPYTYITSLGILGSLTKTQLTFTPRTSQEKQTYTLLKNIAFQDEGGENIDRKFIKPGTEYLLIGYDDKDDKKVMLLRSLVPINKP